MNNCLDITISGHDPIQFVGVSGITTAHIPNIVDYLLNNANNEENKEALELLRAILKNDANIKDSNVTLNVRNKVSEIGDNLIGNSSIEELSKVLFRNNVSSRDSNSKALVPLLVLLTKSNKGSIASANILLTKDSNVSLGIFLGSKYSKSILNVNSPSFISDLYKSLTFTYIENKIQSTDNINPIRVDILSTLNKMLLNEVSNRGELSKLNNLAEYLKLRYFISMISNPNNPLSQLQESRDLLSRINDLISGELVSLIKETLDYFKYGEDLYKKDTEYFDNARTLTEIMSDISDIEYLISKKYYESEYTINQYNADKKTILTEDIPNLKLMITSRLNEVNKSIESLEALKRILKKNDPIKKGINSLIETLKLEKGNKGRFGRIGDLKTRIELAEEAKKRVNKYEDYLLKYSEFGDSNIERALILSLNVPIEVVLNLLQSELNSWKITKQAIKEYQDRKKDLTNLWLPFNTYVKNGTEFIEELTLDLNKENFILIIPEVVLFETSLGTYNSSTEDIKKFIYDYKQLAYKKGVNKSGITFLNLIDKFEQNNIRYDSKMLSSLFNNNHLLEFLYNNVDSLMKMIEIINALDIDPEGFNLIKFLENKIRENTIYKAIDPKNYDFNLYGINCLYDENSFINTKTVYLYDKVGTLNKVLTDGKTNRNLLTVKFVLSKSDVLKIDKNTLEIDINLKLTKLPSEVKDYLNKNKVTKLYIDYSSNTNIDADNAESYFEEVINLINSNSRSYQIGTVIIKGLEALPVKCAKSANNLGLTVHVYTSNTNLFDEIFESENSKLRTSDYTYKFNTDFEIQNINTSRVSEEVEKLRNQKKTYSRDDFSDAIGIILYDIAHGLKFKWNHKMSPSGLRLAYGLAEFGGKETSRADKLAFRYLTREKEGIELEIYFDLLEEYTGGRISSYDFASAFSDVLALINVNNGGINDKSVKEALNKYNSEQSLEDNYLEEPTEFTSVQEEKNPIDESAIKDFIYYNIIDPSIASNYSELLNQLKNADLQGFFDGFPYNKTDYSKAISTINKVRSMIDYNEFVDITRISSDEFEDDPFARDRNELINNINPNYQISNKVENNSSEINSDNLYDALLSKEISGLIYDIGSNKFGKASRGLSGLTMGNMFTLGGGSNNLLLSVKNQIRLSPSKFYSKDNPNIFNVGVKVYNKGIECFITKVNNDGTVSVSSGFGNNIANISDLKFIERAQTLSTIYGDEVIPMRISSSILSGKLLNTETGEIEELDNDIIHNMYSDEIQKISEITGYNLGYLYNLITTDSYSGIGAVLVDLVNNINPNGNSKLLTKELLKSALTIFSNQLSKLDIPVNIIGNNDLVKLGLSTYEYQHPAFVKNGEIYLNLDNPKLHPGSLVHELSHLILGHLRANDNTFEIYRNMINKINLDSPMFEGIKNRYKNRLREDLKEEILADLFGKYFEDKVFEYGGLDNDFENVDLKEVFLKMFAITSEIPEIYNNSDLMNMTISDAILATSSMYGKISDIFGTNDSLAAKYRKASNIESRLIKEGKLIEICV